MALNQSENLSEMFAPVLSLIPGQWRVPYHPSDVLKTRFGIKDENYSTKTKGNPNPDLNKLIVGGLAVETTLADLESFFGTFGEIRDIIYLKDVYGKGTMNNYAEIDYFDHIHFFGTYIQTSERIICGKRVDISKCTIYPRTQKHNDIYLDGDGIIYLEGLPTCISSEDLNLIFMEMFFNVRQCYIVGCCKRKRHETNQGVVQFHNPKIAKFLADRKININGKNIQMQTSEQVYKKGKNVDQFNNLYACEKSVFNFPLMFINKFGYPLEENREFLNIINPEDNSNEYAVENGETSDQLTSIKTRKNKILQRYYHDLKIKDYIREIYCSEFHKNFEKDFQTKNAELKRQLGLFSPKIKVPDCYYIITRTYPHKMAFGKLSNSSPVFMVGDNISPNNKPALVKSKIPLHPDLWQVEYETPKDDFPLYFKENIQYSKTELLQQFNDASLPGFENPKKIFSRYIAIQKPKRKSSKPISNQSPGKDSNEGENSSCFRKNLNQDENFSYAKKEQDDSSNNQELSIIHSESQKSDDSLSTVSNRKNNTIGKYSGYKSFKVIDSIVNKLSDNKETGTLIHKNNGPNNSTIKFEDFLKYSLIDKNILIKPRKELQSSSVSFKSPCVNYLSTKQTEKTSNVLIDKKIGAIENHLQDEAKLPNTNPYGKVELNSTLNSLCQQKGFMNSQR